MRERAADVDYLIGPHIKIIEFRRFEEQDLMNALGPVAQRRGVVAYVCGPRHMTDWAVQTLSSAEGMENRRVLCEKWW